MPETVTERESKAGLLEPPREAGGSFYEKPENDAGDILDSLFGGKATGDADAQDSYDDPEEEDPHTDRPEDVVPAAKSAPKQASAPPVSQPDDDRFTRMEAMLAQMQEQNARLQQALLQRDIEAQPEPQPEEEALPAEPTEPDEETLRLFQMGDPEGTKKFINWVKDVASYQAARNLDTSLPKRVEKTLNTLTESQGQLQSRIEGWWEKNGAKVAAIREGNPFRKAVERLEKSGKLSHKYIEAQLDRVLQHVEEEAKLYGATEASTNGAAKPKPKPNGPVAQGFRPTTGGASRRALANARESEREAANSVDALLGTRPMSSFHM